jgi:hypothetical protein
LPFLIRVSARPSFPVLAPRQLGAASASTPPLRCSRKRCSPLPKAQSGPKKAAAVAAETMEEKMRVISQSELLRLSRAELSVLLHQIVCELPHLRAGSADLRNAHANLQNIRKALAWPEFRPR